MLIQFKAFIVSILMASSGPTPVATLDIQESACLAQGVYYEASNEPMKGKIAVANVIINRTKSSLFPTTICEVLKQKGQFSYWKNIRRIDSRNDAVMDQVNDSIEASVAVMQGVAVDNTHGALYFINPKTAAYKDWLRGMKKTIKIENHTFYKPKNVY